MLNEPVDYGQSEEDIDELEEAAEKANGSTGRRL